LSFVISLIILRIWIEFGKIFFNVFSEAPL
jgi:hypothetical protein